MAQVENFVSTQTVWSYKQLLFIDLIDLINNIY